MKIKYLCKKKLIRWNIIIYHIKQFKPVILHTNKIHLSNRWCCQWTRWNGWQSKVLSRSLSCWSFPIKTLLSRKSLPSFRSDQVQAANLHKYKYSRYINLLLRPWTDCCNYFLITGVYATILLLFHIKILWKLCGNVNSFLY